MKLFRDNYTALCVWLAKRDEFMTALRQEAMKLVENIPEGELVFFMDYIKDYRKKYLDSEGAIALKKEILLEIIKSGILCKKTGLNVEEYVKEMRDDDYKQKNDKNEVIIDENDPFLEALRTRKFVKKTEINVEEYMKEMREERIFYLNGIKLT